jgi:RNA polymerase sigma factor (sigma-70 family)
MGVCPHRQLNVLAFIQTEAAPVLFQIHLCSCLSSLVRQKRAAVENKIVGQTVLAGEASLIGGSHSTIWRDWCASNSFCCPMLDQNCSRELMVEFDEELHPQPVATPKYIAIANEDRKRLIRALESLPPRFREILVLRELEGCSYKEIAAITSIPIGTVMSSLSRARRRIYSALTNASQKEVIHEL